MRGVLFFSGYVKADIWRTRQRCADSRHGLKEEPYNREPRDEGGEGGSSLQFFCDSSVVGDGNGLVGYGLGKAGEATVAIDKGTENAKKNLYRVVVHKGTVPHRAYGKFGGGRVLVMPAAEGTGVIAGGAMRAVLESAGVQDCLAKSKGSSNPHNVVKATLVALLSMRDARMVARDRGLGLRKLFKG